MVLRLKTRESRSLPGLPNATFSSQAPKKLQTFWISCMRKQSHLLKTSEQNQQGRARHVQDAAFCFCNKRLLLCKSQSVRAYLRKSSTKFRSIRMVTRGGAASRPARQKHASLSRPDKRRNPGCTRLPAGRSPRIDKQKAVHNRILVARGGAAR
jgi:hypothetical protein